MKKIFNWIDGREQKKAASFFVKNNPHNGKALFRVAQSGAKDVALAVSAAKKAQGPWSQVPSVQRGRILREFAARLKKHRSEIARLAAIETGKSFKSALAETDGAIDLAFFFAGEGQRLYGKTTGSGIANRETTIIRQPIGVAGLIVAANTPVANVAWKIFPALICGNSAVLKAAEDAPSTAWIFGKIAREAGLPDGVLNIIQGDGRAGALLVGHAHVQVISFTGSSRVGQEIAIKAAGRFCRVSLELGGKNAFVVCDDADLENAASWAVLSAFGNAGQRCSAASRLVVFDSVYDKFRRRLLEKTQLLRVGLADGDDLGPLISKKQLQKVTGILARAKKRGVTILTGGKRLTDSAHAKGYYFEPTLVEGAGQPDEISNTEIFGPVAALYRVKDLKQALALVNNSLYGLTSAIHTQNLNRAHWFAERVQTGIVSVNGGTHGSEPHLPFGGLKKSGNGTREPGSEALDVYSELKNIYLNVNPDKI